MFGYIKTSRLVIRPLEKRDAFPLYQYRHLDIVKKYQSWDDYTLEQSHQLVYRNQHFPYSGYLGQGNFAVEYQEELIGDLYVASHLDRKDCVTIGYTFDPRFWHRGFAREAVQAMVSYLFKYYDKEAIYAFVMEGNVASMRLLLDLGFKLLEYDEQYGDYCFVLKQ